MALPLDEIGGGVVRRRFTMGGRSLAMGHKLSAEEIRGIPPRNLRALVDSNALEVWPSAPEGELHIVHVGRGLHEVFKGQRLTAAPVSREDAESLVNQQHQ